MGTSHSELQCDPATVLQTNSWQKADVNRAVHERVQLCQDPQTEFTLLCESPGVSRINHILRVARSYNPSRETSRTLG